jgi:hypothetical protein
MRSSDGIVTDIEFGSQGESALRQARGERSYPNV